MKVALLLAFLVCLPLCAGYPAGPPDGACGGMTPNHGADAQTSTAPFSITTSATTYKTGDNITVTVTATSPSATPFKGFFIQARKSGSTDAIGRFYIGTETEIKLMTCPGGTNNAVSHNSPTQKTIKKIVWTNDAGSDVIFQATFVNVKTNFWTNVQSTAIKDTSGSSSIKYNLNILVLLAVTLKLLS